jgi:hypothetical protein
MAIRPATVADIDRIVNLADHKRQQYATYAPTFWRNAAASKEKQAPFLRDQIARPNVIALVDQIDDHIVGFVIGAIVDAPPVYDPGTKVCTIDDFVTEHSGEWESVRRALLKSIRAEAVKRGAGLTVVICGHLDEDKRAMLRAEGFGIASEWYVSPL